jgi:hypothetical protein
VVAAGEPAGTAAAVPPRNRRRARPAAGLGGNGTGHHERRIGRREALFPESGDVSPGGLGGDVRTELDVAVWMRRTAQRRDGSDGADRRRIPLLRHQPREAVRASRSTSACGNDGRR